MKTSENLKFLIKVNQLQARLARKFDSKLNGLGVGEFIILLTLSQAENQTMRRVDLAEQVGLTASGITRLLLPMEKIGLVKKETHENDARVSLVTLANGGKTKLEESLDRAEVFCEDIFNSELSKKIKQASEVVEELSKELK